MPPMPAPGYSINQLNLHNLEYESDETKEREIPRLTAELLEYLGTYNNGYMWATSGCQDYEWDNYWLVAPSANFSCKWGDEVSTGNMLSNSVLLQTGFYDETPVWLYENFGVAKEDIPENRIEGSSTICADAKVCPEIVYDAPEEEEDEEGKD